MAGPVFFHIKDQANPVWVGKVSDLKDGSAGCLTLFRGKGRLQIPDIQDQACGVLEGKGPDPVKTLFRKNLHPNISGFRLNINAA
jgi:hypothetical protein